MNQISKILLLCLFILFGIYTPSAYSQENNYRLNIRTDFSIPHIISNVALKNSFRGTYDVTPSLNIPLFKGIYVGGSYKYSTASDKLGLPTNDKAQYMISGGGIKLGYEKFINPTALFTTAICYGSTSIHYKNLPCDTTAPSYKSSYIEPSIGFQFFIEDNFAIGINMSYVGLSQFTFDPYRICFDPYKSFSPSDSQGQTQYLNLGFGFIYSFWKKKKSE